MIHICNDKVCGHTIVIPSAVTEDASGGLLEVVSALRGLAESLRAHEFSGFAYRVDVLADDVESEANGLP